MNGFVPKTDSAIKRQGWFQVFGSDLLGVLSCMSNLQRFDSPPTPDVLAKPTLEADCALWVDCALGTTETGVW